MAADLKALAQAALATIITEQTSSVAAVVANEHTADGIKANEEHEAELSDDGEVGVTTSTIRCNADTLVAGELTKGQTITVGGVPMFLTNFRLDPAGAIVTLDYSKQRPIT